MKLRGLRNLLLDTGILEAGSRNRSFLHLLSVHFFSFRFYLFLEREEGREKEGEKH